MRIAACVMSNAPLALVDVSAFEDSALVDVSAFEVMAMVDVSLFEVGNTVFVHGGQCLFDNYGKFKSNFESPKSHHPSAPTALIV